MKQPIGSPRKDVMNFATECEKHKTQMIGGICLDFGSPCLKECPYDSQLCKPYQQYLEYSGDEY